MRFQVRHPKIPEPACIFIIAKIRNKAAHNPSEFTLENVNGYMEICKLTIAELKQAAPSKAPRPIHKQAKTRWTIRRRPPGVAYSRVIVYFALMLVLVATPFIIFTNTVFIGPRSWTAAALIAAMAIAGSGTLGMLVRLHKISASVLAMVGISTAATLAISHQTTSQSATGLALLALIVGVFPLPQPCHERRHMRSHIMSAITEHTAYLQKNGYPVLLCFRKPDKLLSSWRKTGF